MTTNTYYAKVTATGADSTAPDRVDAVDADIYCNGADIGSVTLLRDRNGKLVSWGEPANWADGNLLAWADTQQQACEDFDFCDETGALVAAVRAVAR